MPRVTNEQLVKQQTNTQNIRNICIIAHVDHGKTTLCDSLISSNGIISERLAGQMRYMDNRKDEQEKLITMKSSSISLLYPPVLTAENENYLINLVDSPGHVDFTGEVSSAVRIADGALVLVDVAEGICVQTQTVLRQAWKERVKPCLVLNKIDRLFTELNQSPEEAYYHLFKILESVNVIMANLMTEEMVLRDDIVEVTDQIDDSNLYFSPERGNVAFASAFDGWAFRIDHFAELYSKKFGMKKSALMRCLWGEYFIKFDKKADKKNQIKISDNSQSGKLPRLFVEFVLKNIWLLYQTVFAELNYEKAKKIVTSLGLDVADRELQPLARYQSKPNLRPTKDPTIRGVLKSIARKWLPLSERILAMAVEILPSPKESAKERIPKLWRSLPPSASLELLQNVALIENDLMTCNKESPHVVAFISKVFTAPFDSTDIRGVGGDAGPRIFTPKSRSLVSSSGSDNNSNDGDDQPSSNSIQSRRKNLDTKSEKLVGFTRIFCGTIRKNQTLHILAPKYDPRSPSKYISSFVVTELYSLMGRSLEPIEYASAGMVFGIGGIEGTQILKTATLSSLPLIPTFSEVVFSQSIVRVAVEPVNPAEMDILSRGLDFLNQADASVEVFLHDRDQIISAAGELHLERCLRDLKEFAPIELKVSAPIVSYQESIIEPAKPIIHHIRAGDRNPVSLYFKIRAIPLSEAVTSFLEQSHTVLSHLFGDIAFESKSSAEFEKFQNNLLAKMIESGHNLSSEISNIWTFGPFRTGTNILFNKIPGFYDTPYWKSICSSEIARDLPSDSEDHQQHQESSPTVSSSSTGEDEEEEVFSKGEMARIRYLKGIEFAIVNAFQSASGVGPLCGEPLRGVAYFIDDVLIYTPPKSKTTHHSSGNNDSSNDNNNANEDDHQNDNSSDDDDDDDNEENGGNVREEEMMIDLAELRSSENYYENEELNSRFFKGNLTSSLAIAFRNAVMMSNNSVKGATSASSSSSLFSSSSVSSYSSTLLSHVKEISYQSNHLMANLLNLKGRSPLRLVEPFYHSDILVSENMFGKTSGVLFRRRGRIINNERRGNDGFQIQAVIPVVESFGISDELMTKTSGAAGCQLWFSHWETLDIDPNWEPTTEDEIEEFGSNALARGENIARKLVDEVRKRKGMEVEDKLVEHADKQRTLSKNK